MSFGMHMLLICCFTNPSMLHQPAIPKTYGLFWGPGTWPPKTASWWCDPSWSPDLTQFPLSNRHSNKTAICKYVLDPPTRRKKKKQSTPLLWLIMFLVFPQLDKKIFQKYRTKYKIWYPLGHNQHPPSWYPFSSFSSQTGLQCIICLISLPIQRVGLGKTRFHKVK